MRTTSFCNPYSLAFCDRAASGKWHPIGLDSDQARCPLGVIRVGLTLRRLLPVFPGKQTFSAATPTGCKRFERGAGAAYNEVPGVGTVQSWQGFGRDLKPDEMKS